MILTVILVVTVVLIAVALGVTSRRKRKSNHLDMIRESGFDMSGLVGMCYESVIKVLDVIVSVDPIESCRIYRGIGPIIKNIRNDIDRFSVGQDSINIDYMLESLHRISEMGKSIATNPNDGITLSIKCELETLRGSFSVMRNNLNDTRKVYSDNNEAWRKESANCKDFIEHLIDIHGKSMKHNDFDDGSVKYEYLMLLHYMLSFHKSVVKLLQLLYSNHKKQQYEQGI